MYHGSASGLGSSPAWTAESNQATALFGASVALAGDVNGDGYADVIVGAYQFDNGSTDEGRAYVYHGSPSGLGSSPAWTEECDDAFSSFGYAVATAGDVNADGYSDVIIGAPEQDLGGFVYVYHGSASGLGSSSDWSALHADVGAKLGFSVATAGDVNADGYSDVIMGAPEVGFSISGSAYVFRGSASGLGFNEVTIDGLLAFSGFGWSVSSAGDVNGDGYSDVVIGAPLSDIGQADVGRIHVCLGSASGVGFPDWTADGLAGGARLGWCVSTAGDVNGDGYSDVIAGSPGFSSGYTGEGLARVHFGNEERGSWIRAPQQRRLGGTAPIAVLGRADWPTGFEIQASFARSLAGFDWAAPATPTVRLEWEVEPSLGGSFDGIGIQSGAPQAIGGSPVTLAESVMGLSTATPHRWRARLRTNNPLLPVTPWFSLAGNGRTETKVRTTASGGRVGRR